MNIIEPGLGAEHVDDIPSRPFGGHDWSEHGNIIRLIDALFTEYAIWYRSDGTEKRIRDPERIRRHLAHFALEAYRTYQADPTLSMGVHLGNEYYNEGGGRYHPKHLSYRIVRNVTGFLVAAGHLELPSGMGAWHPDPKERRTTRFRAARRLIDLCDEHGISRYMITPYENPEVIILRRRKQRHGSPGELAEYADTPFTREARGNLERINDFIAKHRIDLDITDAQEEALMLRLRGREDAYIDFTKTRLVRIFNNGSFEQGGRFYGGWWQQIPGDYRTFITINSKRTVQLDYSGMHFAIMYAQIGMDTPMNDPYALWGFGSHLRGDVKTAFNIIINCGSRGEAIAAIDRRIRDGELSPELIAGERLIDSFEKAHPPIKDKIASGEGVRGQFVDSRVAERLLLKGIDIGLCILPIHDGFITTNGDAFVLERLMDEAFREVTGRTAGIKPESFDLSVLTDAGDDKPYWITRPDGTVERDGCLEGKATSYSRVVSGTALWNILEEGPRKKRNKMIRDDEWRSAR